MNIIRQTRYQVETLTWLRAILLICAEGRKALAEVSEVLRDVGSIRTSCATYVVNSCLGSATMIDIADRLIAAGLGEEVWKAGVFASTKAELIAPPEEKNPAHELLEAIHACNDAAELNALWDHVFDALFEFDDDVEEWKAAAESLIEAGHVERVEEAGKFAAFKVDTVIGWEPDAADDPHNELFSLIDASDDDDALKEFADYVEARLQIAA
jgi:hypothetical protein